MVMRRNPKTGIVEYYPDVESVPYDSTGETIAPTDTTVSPYLSPDYGTVAPNIVVKGDAPGKTDSQVVTPEQEASWESLVGGYNIPYLGEVLPDKIAELPKTSTQQWVEDMVKDRAAGKGVATLATQLTPENVQNYKTLVEKVMQPNYQNMVNKLNEEWHSKGRSFDTDKITSVGTLAQQYDSDVAGKILGMAGSDVDRINLEAGKSLGYGLSLAQMEQANQHLAAGQQFQLDMYKRDVRDKAISGLQNEKVKWFYTQLQRAWDNADWTEYAKLAKDLAEAGQPDVADYIMSFIANVGAAVVGTAIGGPAGGAAAVVAVNAK